MPHCQFFKTEPYTDSNTQADTAVQVGRSHHTGEVYIQDYTFFLKMPKGSNILIPLMFTPYKSAFLVAYCTAQAQPCFIKSFYLIFVFGRSWSVLSCAILERRFCGWVSGGDHWLYRSWEKKKHLPHCKQCFHVWFPLEREKMVVSCLFLITKPQSASLRNAILNLGFTETYFVTLILIVRQHVFSHFPLMV